ncbi:DUF551 domain-containing protein [Escherichia coli]|nr:DUF551 domain-containing protein [Escherichia coli]EEY8188262.1 DUF551 domain-containing protein [Escherichia coli]EEZ1538400.1 DUF551 domain-containing protein [Escherichia coli]EFB7169291.1 DUF551 domain-containing protein [Escherichia coli]EIY5820128.1 DUF551 domain-containing protein [Escherichia coli]
MTTITDKELIKEIKERIGSLDVRDNIERRAYEIALASLEAEPIAMVVPDEMDLLTCHLDGVTKTYADGWNACRAAMLHSAEPVSQAYKLNALDGNSPVTPGGWISCSERMPDDGQHVIILCDGAFVLYAQYRDGEFFDVVRNGDEFFETQSRNVTDWMPLPEPPQEVNRG